MVIAESRIDGDQFIDIITYAKDYLYYRKEEVDALNVFPVPMGGILEQICILPYHLQLKA